MAPAATRRRLACRARRVRRERGRRAGGAWVRRTRSDGRAPRSCVRSARFVSSAIRVGIPEADWADLGAAAELTPSGARDARSGRRTSCPVDLAVQQSDDPLAGESSTRHGSAQRLATVPLRYESGGDGRHSRLGRRLSRKCARNGCTGNGGTTTPNGIDFAIVVPAIRAFAAGTTSVVPRPIDGPASGPVCATASTTSRRGGRDFCFSTRLLHKGVRKALEPNWWETHPDLSL
jgi:hypothetical protein